jgi:TonB family protein
MIRATLLLALAWCTIPRLRRRAAAERHLLWASSLTAASLLPLLNLVLPTWQPPWVGDLLAGLPPSLVSRWTAGQDVDIVVHALGIESGRWMPGSPWSVLWVAGAGLALVTLAIETAQLARLARAARPPADWQSRMARRAARALHIGPRVRLLRGTQNAMPVAWGIRRPRVLLPASADDWPDDRAYAVLAHELAHIRRGDWLVHVLAELACAVYWFNPLFWLARNRMCQESEQAADDVVLGLGVDGGEYATHLLEIVRATRTPSTARATTVAMAHASYLEQRFAALLDARVNRRPATRRLAIGAVILTIVVAVPLSAIGASSLPLNIGIRMSDLPAIASATTPSGLARVAASVPRVRLVEPENHALVTPPEIAEYTTPPLYSEEARGRGVAGVVTLRARIEGDGSVGAARVIKGLGAGLDQNAIVALRQWRFRPGTRAGVPVAMEADVDIEFTLRNDALNAVIANDMATRVGPGVTPPRAIRVVGLPRTQARRRGTVVLDVVLLEDGTPKILRILASVDPALDELALRTFEQWRFSPAVKNGRPVKVRLNAEVRF